MREREREREREGGREGEDRDAPGQLSAREAKGR